MNEMPPVLGLRERSKAERWRRIVQAAREIFREHGYAAATIRAIATRADVGTGTIFSYVRDKRDLLGKIFDEELQELTDACLDGLVPEAPLFDQLMQIFGPRYAYWAVDPTLSRLACQDSFGTSAAERAVYTGAGLFHARRSRIAQFLSDLIRAKQRSGEVFPTHDPVLVGYLLMDVYIGANRRWLTHDDLIPDEGVEELRQLFAIAIRGLRAPASAN
jgi:AcrR family transcriptional regulator